jgi:hypothetical protein
VSGICFEVLGNTSCTTPCCHEEECPAGFGCLQKGAGRYCLPGRLFGPGYTLDRPTGVACADAPNSCKSGLCEQRGDGGSLCRGTCCTDGQCLAAPCRWSRAGQVLRTFCDPLGILMGQGRTGDPCRDETDCHSGVCVAPGRCADLCCRTAECVGGTVCGFVGGIGDSVVRACVPSGGGGTASGQECLEDADCTSGNCIEGTCREVCCLDQHCAGGDACRPRPGIEPFLATVCVPPDSP